jgi:hypothetical protein
MSLAAGRPGEGLAITAPGAAFTADHRRTGTAEEAEGAGAADRARGSVGQCVDTQMCVGSSCAARRSGSAGGVPRGKALAGPARL